MRGNWGDSLLRRPFCGREGLIDITNLKGDVFQILVLEVPFLPFSFSFLSLLGTPVVKAFL